MLAEKARREAVVQQSLTVQPYTAADNERWAKFQDGIRIVFQPGNGWCAEIHEGSMGYGDTIAEAIANLRARWEERSAAPVVQESSTTPDAGKVEELQEANRELVELLAAMQKPISDEWHLVLSRDHLRLTNANRELVEALEELLESKSKTATRVMEAQDIARTILAKHKGAA